MKKFYYVIGAFATAAAIFTFIAVMLKKLRISLSIESINDDIEEPENTDIELSISENKKEELEDELDFSETEELIRQELDGMIEADDDDIEVEIKVEE